MTGLRVIAGGLQTTVQDFGRPHVQHLGIPASGAMDRTALHLANRLVGNDEAAPRRVSSGMASCSTRSSASHLVCA